MNGTVGTDSPEGLSRLKLYLALSRTPHGLLDMATPLLCALLWLGRFPPVEIICLGLATVFAGYTAVYALNDVVDYRIDRDEIRREKDEISGDYLDALLVHHPMAQGLLSFRSGLLWTIAWGILAVVGAFLLNPVCLLIFIVGCVLEAAYCLLFRISYLRVLVSGAVKTCGGIAAVYAVDPQPSGLYVLGLFLWLFAWEIGGQNIPADLTDVEMDRQNQAKTVPVRFGSRRASLLVVCSLIATLILHGVLMAVASGPFGLPYIAVSLLAGGYLLVVPALRLCRRSDRRNAMTLFNRASCYPLATLTVVLANMVG